MSTNEFAVVQHIGSGEAEVLEQRVPALRYRQELFAVLDLCFRDSPDDVEQILEIVKILLKYDDARSGWFLSETIFFQDSDRREAIRKLLEEKGDVEPGDSLARVLAVWLAKYDQTTMVNV